jgi:hypothetical protein
MGGDDCTSHIVASLIDAETQIPIDRLDRLLVDIPYSMMKLDIEGYEPFAIRGASLWTKNQNPPVMIVEMSGYSKQYGISTSDFIKELDQIGYFTAIYNPESREIRRTKEPWKVPVDNVLAIAEERLDFVMDRLQKNTA